ncbi:MAG: IclR family transcriptional regulator [Sphaerochaetaceae bacterium]
MQLVDRVVEVLDAVAAEEKGMLLVDLTKSCDISKTALYRITQSLQKIGLLYRDDSDRFFLGPKMFSWMGKYQNSFILVKIARPIIEELHKVTGETIHLFHYRDGEAFYIDKIESLHPLTIRSRVGTTQPLYCTAGGKAILGSLPHDQLARYMDKHVLEQRTTNTITDSEALIEVLKKGEAKQFYEEIEENEPGIRCVAASIKDVRGFPIGAVSITMPTFRAPEPNVIEQWGKMLREKADEIERELMQEGDL